MEICGPEPASGSQPQIEVARLGIVCRRESVRSPENVRDSVDVLRRVFGGSPLPVCPVAIGVADADRIVPGGTSGLRAERGVTRPVRSPPAHAAQHRPLPGVRT